MSTVKQSFLFRANDHSALIGERERTRSPIKFLSIYMIVRITLHLIIVDELTRILIVRILMLGRIAC